jgi:uracil-DNA glycosylase
MGGSADEYTRAEAGRLLQWWLDAGVDTAISEQPRQWLKAPASRSAGVVAEIAAPSPAQLPADYDTFRAWLETSTGLPLERAGARRILPHGLPGARIMLLSDAPAREDAAEGKPIGGDAWLLATRMLAAIKLSPDEAYSASLACFHTPGTKLGDAELARCADIARRHIALVKPELCLKVRGRPHRIEGVRTVATFHPRWLLQRPADKALAWRDLLLLMEEE